MGMKNNYYGRRMTSGAPCAANYARNTCPLCSQAGTGGCACGVRGRDIRPGCANEERDVPLGREACSECHELMHQLQKLDFSIQETVLYLDAYPDCCEARTYYHHLLQQRNDIVLAYEKKCGPLTVWGNQSTTSWDWCKNPWPWQPDFAGNDSK